MTADAGDEIPPEAATTDPAMPINPDVITGAK